MRARLVLVVAAAVLVLALDPITASADGLTSSINPSTVGQAVTFTAVYAVPCADGVAVHFFTIDGADAAYTTHAGSGQVFTTTLTVSSLSAGEHVIAFTWSTSMPPGPSCGATMTLTQTVNSPPPPPAESPLPSPPSSVSPPAAAATLVRPTLIALAGTAIVAGATMIVDRLLASGS